MRWLIILLVVIPLKSFAVALPGLPQEIRQVDYVVSDAATPPGPESNWQHLRLPYAPRGAPIASRAHVMWLRFRMPAPANPDNLALYIRRHNVSLEVYMNGAWIGGMKHDARPSPIGWNRPIYIELQAGSWRDENTFKVRLDGGYFGATMSAIDLDSRDKLKPLFENRMFWQIETSKWSFSLSIFLGVFTLWLWSRRRKDSMYLLFAASCFSWAMVTLYLFLDVIPLHLRLWLNIIHSAIDWFGYFLVCFMARAANFQLDRFEKFLLAIATLATVSHFLVPADYFFSLAYGFHLLQILSMLGLAVFFLRDAIRHPGELTTWYTIGFACMLTFWIHDLWYMFVSPMSSYMRASNLSQLSIPLLLIMLFAHLVNRFVTALNDAEALNEELESRVAAHKSALDVSFEENRQMMIRESAASERDKIYRDLHDDVGSKLVSILHAGNDSRLKLLARGALESLREAIYRANYQDQPLAGFVLDIQDEMRVRAENAGLEFESSQSSALPEVTLPSTVCYHLTRICREIITNVLHHSRASKVVVSLENLGPEILCTIEDDGIGFDINQCQGNGLKNVEYRAAEIGGHVAWESEPGLGTRVVLSFNHLGKAGDTDSAGEASVHLGEFIR